MRRSGRTPCGRRSRPRSRPGQSAVGHSRQRGSGRPRGRTASRLRTALRMPRQATPTPAASASRVCPCADPRAPTGSYPVPGKVTTRTSPVVADSRAWGSTLRHAESEVRLMHIPRPPRAARSRDRSLQPWSERQMHSGAAIGARRLAPRAISRALPEFGACSAHAKSDESGDYSAGFPQARSRMRVFFLPVRITQYRPWSGSGNGAFGSVTRSSLM